MQERPNKLAVLSIVFAILAPFPTLLSGHELRFLGLCATALLGLAAIGAGVDGLSRKYKRYRPAAVVGVILGAMVILLAPLAMVIGAAI